MERLDLEMLEAETDEDSVGFYRRCGFAVEETPARGGNVRHTCTLIR